MGTAITESAREAPPQELVDEGTLSLSSPPDDWPDTARRLLILIALYTIPAIVVVRPVQDLDIWWHLRTGRWIAEHGAVPATDPFSQFGQGKPWVA